jgi:ribonuclease T2
VTPRRRVLASALLLFATASQAQESRDARPGIFDFWVLALSWSPGFCEIAGPGRGRDQCDAGSNLGFVVHGLWPQYENGYPSFCAPGERSPPRAAIEEAKGLFPDDGLARYEWRRHGGCSGLAASAYFRAVRAARALVTVPERLDRPAVGTKALPIEIERAFADANPGLRPDMMAIGCARRHFQEIRICLTKDLRGFRTCPEVDRDGCRGGEVTIAPVR